MFMYLYVIYIYMYSTSNSNGRESECVTMVDVNLLYWSEYLRTGKYHASIRPYSRYVLTPSTLFISPLRYSQSILLFLSYTVVNQRYGVDQKDWWILLLINRMLLYRFVYPRTIFYPTCLWFHLIWKSYEFVYLEKIKMD